MRRVTLPRVARLVLVPLLLGAAVATAVAPLRPAYAAAAACDAGYGADYNGDGVADLAVADPHAKVGTLAEAGHVVVLYGTKGGRFGSGGSALLSQDSTGVPGFAETGDSFGTSLSSADLDCDGFTDLVVGVPYEDVGSKRNAGVADVVYGSARGLGKGRFGRQLDATTFKVKPAAGDLFGWAVDTKQRAYTNQKVPSDQDFAMAIGAPGRKVKGAAAAGAVGYLHPLNGKQQVGWIVQGANGVDGVPQPGDRFGAAVALGYLEDGLDLLVGAPGEDVGRVKDAGQVTLVLTITGGSTQFSDTFDLSHSRELGGEAETGDAFGSSIDVASAHSPDPDNSLDYLAIGIPGKDVGTAVDAGAVALYVAYFIEGPGAVGLYTQALPQISGRPETGDRLGEHVWLSHDGNADILLGLPHEDGTHADSGAFQRLTWGDHGLVSPTFTQNTKGIPGVSEAGDHLGESVAQVEDADSSAYVVGVPDDATYTSGMVEVIPVGGGKPYALIPGVGDVPGEGASRFGAAIADSGREFREGDTAPPGPTARAGAVNRSPGAR